MEEFEESLKCICSEFLPAIHFGTLKGKRKKHSTAEQTAGKSGGKLFLLLKGRRSHLRFALGTLKGSGSLLQKYVLDHSLREHPTLNKLKMITSQRHDGRMMVSCDQAQLMANLARLIRAKKVIEIGVFTGYNTLNMALNIPDDGKVIACDINEDIAKLGRPFWKEAGVEHKIDLRIKPAIQTLDELLANGEAGTFDFAFIDADKEANVLSANRTHPIQDHPTMPLASLPS
ncbi:hypothetical protein JD844_031714 [Phrynosoma platyrhinos]|uniref:Catechol O-methyltransferase domain-containing protein 1 n=1 Tax=Phrynosoma platyrhinos TaxID=52577 RepID=A0ABQ7T3W9_PHRPL|nr:hypothetical protein JD844_031714 [Phrynosoma platyrhinos]